MPVFRGVPASNRPAPRSDTTTSALDQLNADSLDRVEVRMALEEEFGVPIPDEAIGKWSTVGDVVDWLAARRTPPRGG
ncbi:MAG: acyl carrier protein [Acidobacteria bacterium]|nr:MAG: acyl carrier protein [Acidobacteriota bacterium]PYR49114.1 MAG: acyl carrier protein [Acidobacteriota bacterium]